MGFRKAWYYLTCVSGPIPNDWQGHPAHPWFLQNCHELVCKEPDLHM